MPDDTQGIALDRLAEGFSLQGGEDASGVLVKGLTADSREVKPGCLFAALPGTVVDGAAFIPQAIEAGAVAILGPSELDTSTCAGLPVVAADNARNALAVMARRFFGRQPETVVAVTGTNGKTSVVSFLRQIWHALGIPAASIGTVGVTGSSGSYYLAHTTPDPVKLQELLARLADDGVTHVALEASSHGLAQNRLDGVEFAAGAFTNLTRDHLDYHATFEDYFAAKLRLFSDLLPAGSAAVINADMPEMADVAAACDDRGISVFTVGRAGDVLKLEGLERVGLSQKMTVRHWGRRFEVALPLVGEFQASNALVAAGLAIATGSQPDAVFAAEAYLEGASGRLELVATTDSGAAVFVDYAHTPDALENALGALRPYAQGRLAVIFGCGGDRDPGKRPQMGAVAAAGADVVYVTDDNPRTEDPAVIRAAALAACPDAEEIGDRAEAIRTAIGRLGEDDVLLVAGKGHETGQIVGDQVLPFSDQDVVREVVQG